MSKSNSFETDILEMIFLNTAIANLGDATGPNSATAGSLYISLHTSDPGEAGVQNTNECSYTGYARVAVGRSGANWTVTNDQVANDGVITFGENTGASQTATHFGIGTQSSGATQLLYSAALNSSLVIDTNVTPEFAASALTVTEG